MCAGRGGARRRRARKWVVDQAAVIVPTFGESTRGRDHLRTKDGEDRFLSSERRPRGQAGRDASRRFLRAETACTCRAARRGWREADNSREFGKGFVGRHSSAR